MASAKNKQQTKTTSITTALSLAAAIGIGSTLGLAPSPAHAQAFPNKPLKIVVPFAAGGSADLVRRILAQGMSTQLGQAVTVKNRGGAGGVVGIDVAAALNSADIAQQLLAQGALPAPGTPEEFRITHRDEQAKWAPIVKANNIKLD